ncbi:hypothetical protein [Pannonibacter sp. SL95]|uniref:hypothetical protein n=1 Tax=Pannonibacter sp. SL95 TaxID=2995153 RepID=UPI0022729D06|nr:hypothetical protein [Pannonibacter sp. SL95]MCY1704563.1 hypothetical protein [Pannonibacter sp. SL95]
MIGFVCLKSVQGEFVLLRKDSHGFQAKFIGRTEYTNCDFRPIGDKYLADAQARTLPWIDGDDSYKGMMCKERASIADLTVNDASEQPVGQKWDTSLNIWNRQIGYIKNHRDRFWLIWWMEFISTQDAGRTGPEHRIVSDSSALCSRSVQQVAATGCKIPVPIYRMLTLDVIWTDSPTTPENPAKSLGRFMISYQHTPPMLHVVGNKS